MELDLESEFKENLWSFNNMISYINPLKIVKLNLHFVDCNYITAENN